MSAATPTRLAGDAEAPGSAARRVRWTQAMLDILRDGIEAEGPMLRTALRVGVSEPLCFKKARELGWLPGPRPRPGGRKAEGKAGGA